MRLLKLLCVVPFLYACEGTVDAQKNQATNKENQSSKSMAFTPAPVDWVASLEQTVDSATLLDFNEDGVLDLVVLTQSKIFVLQGDGAAGFGMPKLLDETADLTAMNTGRLGKDDSIVLADCAKKQGMLRIHNKNESPEMSALMHDCLHLQVGDFDGDGTQDVALASLVEEDRYRWQFWSTQPELTQTTQTNELFDVTTPFVTAVGDVDGDGADDLVFLDEGVIYKAYVSGKSVVRTPLLDNMGHVGTLRLLDVDGDGDLDLFVGIMGNQDRLFVSDGAGRFADVTRSALPVEDGVSVSTHLADFDGDGLMDLLVGTQGGFDRLYRALPAGRFEDRTPALGFVDTSTHTILAGDLDGDKDLDVVSVGTQGQIRVFARTGDGS